MSTLIAECCQRDHRDLAKSGDFFIPHWRIIMNTKVNNEKTSFTARELRDAEFQPVKWLIENVSPQGFSYLAGKPKIGKSFLELQKCIAIVNPNGRLFDYPAATGRVLYISLEDNARRLKRRIDHMLDAMGIKNSSWLDNLEIETSWRRFDKGGVDDLLKRLEKKKYIYAVADTYKKVFPIKDNDSGIVTQFLTPIHNLTKSGEFSFEFVDHHRKFGDYSGDVIEDISGSIGKGGVADTVWALYRERGKREARLTIASRDTEEEGFEVVFDKEKTLWKKKEAVEVNNNTIQMGIIEYMKQMDEQSYVMEIAGALGKDKGLISKEMSELVAKGVIGQGNKQGRKIPYYLKNGYRKH